MKKDGQAKTTMVKKWIHSKHNNRWNSANNRTNTGAIKRINRTINRRNTNNIHRNNKLMGAPIKICACSHPRNITRVLDMVRI